MDFYKIKERSVKKDVIEIYPEFKVCRSKDLMIRGNSFHAVWNEENQIWCTDEYEVQKIVDKDLWDYRSKVVKERPDVTFICKTMNDYSSNSWVYFKKYLKHLADNSKELDSTLTFANTDVKKNSYISKKLDYPLEEAPIPSYEELISTLYDEEEREKIEWAIGSIISGDSKHIQKFIVLYGEGGTGKSTMLNIVQKLFNGYYTTFDAKALTSTSNSFSTEVFKNNPLVAIQHDGDLSRIEDNTKLNSIVSHEDMTLNEKYKSLYMSKINCFLFMGTNKPVRITDAKSGIIRRLIDVKPSGKKVSPKKYQTLYSQIDFELGGIAFHCLNKYRSMGKHYYDGYKPVAMMLQTDVFFNFIEDNYLVFKNQNYTTLSQSYDLYKEYCDTSLIDYKLPRHKFREELKNYFRDFSEIGRIEGRQVRSLYSEFITDKFKSSITDKVEHQSSLTLDYEDSILDDVLKSCKAQYANKEETPLNKWKKVTTKLSDIDTKILHYVQPPLNHIVIDFDLKDETGKKSLEKNLEMASKWPPTYAEYSKGGNGIHLHYIYDGDVSKLSSVYDENIEVKVFSGDSSLRRRVSKCNNIEVAVINSGIPLKGEKMIDFTTISNEAALRTIIKNNLRKAYHPGTKPSMDFIKKVLDDAYDGNVVYDITDMKADIFSFAANSTNQAEYCMKLMNEMQFASKIESTKMEYLSDELIFFDLEVFPNLFLINWKYPGDDCRVVRMFNPTPVEVEALMKTKLIGFNCRRYDNHILYGRYLGYNNHELYTLSQRLINNDKTAPFREAYKISYTDIYDFSSKKQSLKKFQIELGLKHLELGLPWDQPVDESLWERVAEYGDNDVIATEAVFYDRKEDFMARQLLSELSGLSVNDSTASHVANILFESDPNPQEKFVYTDLSEEFEGYEFDMGKSTYRGEDPSEGGYVYSEPGMYENVAVLDVESMHPTSACLMNIFGPYTKNFKDILDIRVLIKHKDYDSAKTKLGGILEKYLTSKDQADKLSYALKIIINTVYGLTSAKFPNKFRDDRNKDNIVAKRGALFMIDLKNAVQEKGFTVAHIKTDSIKIPNATQEIIDFVFDFGKKYGYKFEHESQYEKMCLINKAVYVAKEKGIWTTVGAQFAHPYVFKTMFSKEKLLFEDFCETKAVKSAIYLDMNENLGEDEHEYRFVGKVGQFCPVKKGKNGGILYREDNGNYHHVTGTKGYRWMESEMLSTLDWSDAIDITYYNELVDEAKDAIAEFGDIEQFLD